MAISQIPPWLKSPDVIGAMEGGARIGLGKAQLDQRAQEDFQSHVDEQTKLGLEQQKIGQDASAAAAQIRFQQQQLDAAAKQHAMQTQVEQEKIQSDFMLTQQQNAVADSYHQAQLGLAKQKLNQTAETQAKTIADRIGFMQWRAQNPDKSAAEGLAMFPYAKLSTSDTSMVNPQYTTEQTKEVTPGTKPTPGIPEHVKKSGWWFGIGDKTIPATPGTPGTPASTKTITRKIPIQSPADSAKEIGGESQTQTGNKFNVGDQVKQNGVTYEYDGESWNPVNETD